MLANKTFIIFRKGRDKEIQGQLWECGDIENGVADNQIKNTEWKEVAKCKNGKTKYVKYKLPGKSCIIYLSNRFTLEIIKIATILYMWW